MMSNVEVTSGQLFRPEIQGLRAVAVVSVVIFHLWPDALPGGYVGVDVFFVISGYLITGMLLREAQERATISLMRFYARRIRRLLPAATLVLLVVALATPLLPAPLWEETAAEILASALYVQNWLLAFMAVDYLGAENAASPVQHYWTLSVEEQFYIVWPILILSVVTIVARVGGDLRRALLWTLSAAVAASFAASILMTQATPEASFFTSHTRMWELGLGGLLALYRRPCLSARAGEFLRIAGLGAIAAACVVFSGETAMPGYAALLPTLGAALVIVAGQARTTLSAARLLNAPPAQYLGDISYSMYLWHWPLIVFYAAAVDEEMTVISGVAIVALCIVLAHVSKIHVEDRFRYASRTQSLGRTIVFGAGSVSACIAAASAIYLVALSGATTTDVFQADRYPGAAALLADAPVSPVDNLWPLPARLKKDLPDAYARKCHLRQEVIEPDPCEYGSDGGDPHIVLIGDSHAASWIPALEVAARSRQWRLTTHTKSACPLLKVGLQKRKQLYTACLQWGARILQRLHEVKPDVVIVTHAKRQQVFGIDDPEQNRQALITANVEVWRDLLETGAQIIVLADTPRMPADLVDCVSAATDCLRARDAALPPDPIVAAHAQLSDSIELIDMSDGFCTLTHCPAVIGNVIVWRDSHHFTATYSRTLGPFLAERLEAVLDSTRDTRPAPAEATTRTSDMRAR